MESDRLIIAVLLLLCSCLLVAIIVMGIMYMKKEKSEKEEKTEKTESKTITIVDKPDDGMPIYPRKDPVYPLRRMETPFQQVGTLINKPDGDGEPTILPLFGRPMPNRSERWEYYTATDKQHMLKIPISFEKQDCLEEIGCREVYNRDKVFIPAYEKEFEVTLYKYRS